MKIFSKILRLTVLLPVCLVLFLNGASSLLQSNFPFWSLKLNPFNTTARVNYVVKELAKNPDDVKMESLLSHAQKAVFLARGDARGYSAIAEVFYRAGNKEKAAQLYHIALQVGPTEINALLRRLEFAILGNDTKEVAARIDVILRRWPSNVDKIFPVIAAMIQSKGGLIELKALMASDPPWRYNVLVRLVDSLNGLAFAQNLLLERYSKNQNLDDREKHLVINSLLAAGRISESYSMFILTMDKADRQKLGHIFNPTFKPIKIAPVFRWTISDSPGAEVAMIQNENTMGGPGLRVRFFDKPARLGNVRQYLSLPSGSYNLETEVRAAELKLPKGLFWQITCRRSAVNRDVVKLNIEQGTYASKVNSVKFFVPRNDCPLQQLRLKTGINSESWIDRYQGSVTFKHVTIQSTQ